MMMETHRRALAHVREEAGEDEGVMETRVRGRHGASMRDEERVVGLVRGGSGSQGQVEHEDGLGRARVSRAKRELKSVGPWDWLVSSEEFPHGAL
jgi:hypothetical protein